ncbi:hypothetical protein OS493_024212 [Desmophyllum pertusum]|uniref:Uncharacterized protein n=1 Tax=Desmophyllum pertusum TaxID=174260 RepID=A0A9W9ZB03_9CNID|nr:hypothetical protein OS493_024212 [Desmophyllum pertusum]
MDQATRLFTWPADMDTLILCCICWRMELTLTCLTITTNTPFFLATESLQKEICQVKNELID